VLSDTIYARADTAIAARDDRDPMFEFSRGTRV
jgi:hypothetical protein